MIYTTVHTCLQCLFQIIETSEKVLAQRLAHKGKHLTREEVSILLAQHLKTIEKLQQVQSAGRLQDAGDYPPSCPQSGRSRTSENKRLLAKRPGSAAKLRKLTHKRPDSPAAPVTQRSELPPIDRTKGNSSLKPRLSQIPLSKGDNQGSTCGQTARVTYPSNPQHVPSVTNRDVGPQGNEALKSIEVSLSYCLPFHMSVCA